VGSAVHPRYRAEMLGQVKRSEAPADWEGAPGACLSRRAKRLEEYAGRNVLVRPSALGGGSPWDFTRAAGSCGSPGVSLSSPSPAFEQALVLARTTPPEPEFARCVPGRVPYHRRHGRQWGASPGGPGSLRRSPYVLCPRFRFSPRAFADRGSAPGIHPVRGITPSQAPSIRCCETAWSDMVRKCHIL
jgi:hypothetical protein